MSRNSVIRIAGDIANPPSNVSPAIEIVQNDPNNTITGRFLFKFHLISKSSKLCRGLPESWKWKTEAFLRYATPSNPDYY